MRAALLTLTHVRTWLIPIVMLVALAAIFPAIYLASTVDPQGNVRDLPVGLVVEPQQTTEGPDMAANVAKAITSHSSGKLDVRRMSATHLRTLMGEDRISGAVVIPADFNHSLMSLFPGSAKPIVPTIRIRTNAGDGGIAGGLVTGNLTPLLGAVAKGLGAKLLHASATPVPPANATLLAQPFHIVSAPYAALPANSGFGTSAFYYAMILVLVAFLGASAIGPMVDSSLGFAPSEVGPIVDRRPYVPVSRLGTFVAKAAIMLIASPLAALAIQLVATGPVGIRVPDPVMMWTFSTVVIGAVGTSALAVFAIFAGVGAIVNTLFFIALSMSSSGGTVPIAAIPPFFRWLSEFEPFHPIIDGMRASLYFNGNAAAGLADAWLRVAIGGGIGIALGIAVTVLYGRVGRFSRHPGLSAARS
jgi:hypothetical protein